MKQSVVCNYRIGHRPKTEPLLGHMIYEVFYEEDGQVKMYAQDPISPFGDIPDELYEDMCNMMRAFDEEPLNLDYIDYLLARKARSEEE